MKTMDSDGRSDVYVTAINALRLIGGHGEVIGILEREARLMYGAAFDRAAERFEERVREAKALQHDATLAKLAKEGK